MKRILLVALAAIMTVCVLVNAVGCNSLIDLVSGSEDETPENETPENTVNITSIKIADIDISQYKIVYASPDRTLKKLKNTLTTEYDFDGLSAKYLSIYFISRS